MRIISGAEALKAFPSKLRARIKTPVLTEMDWQNLDFLSWLHSSGHLAYVVYEFAEYGPLGLVLQKGRSRGKRRASMCSWCLTAHSGEKTSLFTTELIGQKNKIVGNIFCSDLQCSLYVRGLMGVSPNQMPETVSTDEKILRLIYNVEDFFKLVYGFK